MKNLLSLLFCVLMVYSCSKKKDSPTVENLPPVNFSDHQFTFRFELETPHYISINDNDDGSLISSTTIETGEEVTIRIPAEFEKDLYNINLIYNRKYTYLPKDIEVVSYMDIAPGEVILNKATDFESDYKAIYYEPATDIERFINDNTYFQRDGYVELGVNNRKDPMKLVLLKLKNEDQIRYQFFENPLEYPDSIVNVYDLPVADDVREIRQSNNLEFTRVRIFGQISNQKTQTPIYDTYESSFNEDKVFKFPLLDNLFKYYTQASFFTDSQGSTQGFFTSGLATQVALQPYQLETLDNQLNSFRQTAEAADIVNNSFYGEGYEWHVIENNANGINFVKPVFSDEIMEAYPELEDNGSLHQSNLYTLLPTNQMEYREIVLPRYKILGTGFGTLFRYGISNRYPEFTYVSIKY